MRSIEPALGSIRIKPNPYIFAMLKTTQMPEKWFSSTNPRRQKRMSGSGPYSSTSILRGFLTTLRMFFASAFLGL